MIWKLHTPLPLKAGAVILALSFALVGNLPTFAADDGGGGGGGGGGGSSGSRDKSDPDNPIQCREGMTYNKTKKICEWASLLDDEMLSEQGRSLALAGFYENALDALMAVRDKDDATVLTYIGYANRKMGKVDEGIAWYHKALALEPENLYTREYLGEGYVAAGRMDLAELQLAELEALCGKTCEQYEDLAAAIAGEPEH
jgi:tetratricopeptide (TPR) repeat protein